MRPKNKSCFSINSSYISLLEQSQVLKSGINLTFTVAKAVLKSGINLTFTVAMVTKIVTKIGLK